MKKVEVISRHAAASFIVFAEYSPPPYWGGHSFYYAYGYRQCTTICMTFVLHYSALRNFMVKVLSFILDSSTTYPRVLLIHTKLHTDLQETRDPWVTISSGCCNPVRLDVFFSGIIDPFIFTWTPMSAKSQDLPDHRRPTFKLKYLFTQPPL